MTNQANPFPLGRHQEFDERSRLFNVAAIFEVAYKPRSYTWARGPQLNQTSYPACVGFSFAEELQDKPVVVPGINNTLGLAIYNEAHAIDGIPGPHDGTSVLAGAKAVQARGHLDEYRWAFNVDDLFIAVGYKGPAIIGIPWFDDMWYPDSSGFIRHGNGNNVGGHALSVRGTKAFFITSSGPASTVTQNVLDHSRSWFRVTNHWVMGNAAWGIGGECFFTVEQLDALLHMGGDACIPVKRR